MFIFFLVFDDKMDDRNITFYLHCLLPGKYLKEVRREDGILIVFRENL